jgi:hypothetical protein
MFDGIARTGEGNQYPATIAPGAAIDFPNTFATTGSITRTGAGTFNIHTVGKYRVSWQVSITEAGQLQVSLSTGGIQAFSTVGRATGTDQIVGDTVITTTVPDTVLSILNPAGNPIAITVTLDAGGASPVAANLVIRRLA